MASPTCRLVSTGMWAPDRVLTNRDLEKIVATTDEWITERTGIKERRIADEKTPASDMAFRASLAALEEAEVEPADIDAIILSTATPDRLLPSMACDVQAHLGAHRAVAFDLIGACSGWLYSLSVARGFIDTGQARNVLCVAAEKMSAIVDWSDRSTCVLFGDAAGASVVQPANGTDRGIISSYMRSDGCLAELLYRPPQGVGFPLETPNGDGNGYVKMQGREVFKAAVRSMCEAADAVLEEANLTIEDVDLLVPHQANIRIIESMARYAGMPMDRVWVNIDRYGNTSSASIPVSLHEARQQGRIEEGSLILMTTFGAGLTWAATLVRW